MISPRQATGAYFLAANGTAPQLRINNSPSKWGGAMPCQEPRPADAVSIDAVEIAGTGLIP